MPEYRGKSYEELKLEDEEPERLGRDILACIAVHRIAKARKLGRETSACIAIQMMSEGFERQNVSACIDIHRMAGASTLPVQVSIIR